MRAWKLPSGAPGLQRDRPKAKSKNHRVTLGGMKILIADADLITRTLVERSMVQAGFDVLSVSTAAETEMMLLADADITTLVMDGRTSGDFGPGLCQQIRVRIGERPLFVVMMVKRDEGSDVKTALDGGANEVIGKPVNIDELTTRVALGARLIEAETGLWAARAYLSAVMDNLDVAVIITGADGRVVQANEALARVGGVAPEHIIGRDRDRVNTHWQGKATVKSDVARAREDIDLPGRHRRVLRLTQATSSLPWGQIRVELCQDASKEILYDELLEKSSSTDPATGVLNRAGTETALAKSLERARRHSEGLSVGAVRVRGLPAARGLYAPALADRVLRTLAQLLVRLTRNTDEVGRWSEDGFVLVLHNAAPTQAQVVIKRLEAAVGKLKLEEAPELVVTTGITGCEATDDSVSALVERAFATMEKPLASPAAET